MTSNPTKSIYTHKTPSACPTPCVPSTGIVRRLCVATVISCVRARDLLLLRRRRRSALPCRLRLRAKHFLISINFPINLLSLSSFLALNLVLRREFSRPTPRRPLHLPTRSKSDAYSWALLLRPAFRGGKPVLGPWPFLMMTRAGTHTMISRVVVVRPLGGLLCAVDPMVFLFNLSSLHPWES